MNSPLALTIAVAIITIAILSVLSLKAEVKTGFNATNTSESMVKKEGLFQKAPELQGISGYINTNEGFKLSNVKGKVILVDFWTYTCIDCIRTLPYLTAWDEKYRDKGLVIVGVHTPEFEFEKDYNNVKQATQKYGVKYPVVQDNDYATWRAYGNLYWPHKYLIDADGFIRYDHIGEGGYAETEEMIQKLLMERDQKIQMSELVTSNASSQNFDLFQIGTPELYLGYGFARAPLGNTEGFKPEQTVTYSIPQNFQDNLVYFDGTWKNNPDNMELVSDSGKIVLKYKAKTVNLVAGGKSNLTLQLDGVVLTQNQLGSDAILKDGNPVVFIDEQRLYNVVDGGDYSERTITIDVKGKGFKLYTFTFG